MKPIKAVLLDLDNTVYPYSVCNAAGKRKAFSLAARYYKKSIPIIRVLFEESRVRLKRDLGDSASAHSRFLYFQKLTEAIEGRTNISFALQLHNAFWRSYFSKMKLRPGVTEFLTFLKQSHVKVAIVSDLTTEIQLNKILHLGIEQYIDVVVTSEESGMDKPAPNTLKLALEKLQVRSDEVILIGDTYERDVLAAAALGMRSMLLFSKPLMEHKLKAIRCVQKSNFSGATSYLRQFLRP